MKIGIVGLGLMGGSLAKAIKKYALAEKIYGYTKNEKTKKEISELNLVDELVDIQTLKEKSDMIILAIPVEAIIEFLPNLLDISKTTTIMDLGSTKKLIVDNIPKKIRENFIAAHPMVGTEKSGPKAAKDDFYEGHTVVLCDLEKNSDLHTKRAKELFQNIGMRLVFMDSSKHDIHACYMSHLPHAISFSLANTVMNHEDPKSIIALAAGGFKDMSRVAKSSPDMWSDIFRQNRENLLDSIDLFDTHMSKIKTMLINEEYEELNTWMKKANSLHEIL